MVSNFIKLDEEGYLLNDQGGRLTDESLGLSFFSSLKMDDRYVLHGNVGKQPAIVEAFDEPVVIRHLELKTAGLVGTAAYGFRCQVDLHTLCLDEWDRFHGLTMNGVPFVFSRNAQVQFFDLLDQFEDDSVQIQSQIYKTPPWLNPNPDVSQESFWSDIYKTETSQEAPPEVPPWDLGEPNPALKDILPQLKIAKCRVLVVGCGRGHDAAHFADQGHVVTAVDFSAEAITQARENYGNRDNLRFIQHDVFKMNPSEFGPFDMIFEHTCYCAIDPTRRTELVQQWKKLLTDRGYLLGIFFAMSKRVGPPYGGSEWELKQRLSPHFHFLYWTRWRNSLPRRSGRELIIYAQKK